LSNKSEKFEMEIINKMFKKLYGRNGENKNGIPQLKAVKILTFISLENNKNLC
jgi:hypothetical protein